MTEESTNLIADIRRLEGEIDNLRWTVIVLIIIVSLLTIYVIYQLAPHPFFLAFGLIIIICIVLLNRACIKKEVAPPP